ncbi:MAG: Ig-like domain-containing protein [Gammaproteobacteria bacterium]|nr:Ig-like domain-containing protein [Gammaproteobacteria bacterium]
MSRIRLLSLLSCFILSIFLLGVLPNKAVFADLQANDDSYPPVQSGGTFRDIPSGVMRNDNFGGAVGVTAQLVRNSANGGWVNLQRNGSFDYTAPANFVGVDSFTYRLEYSPAGGGGTMLSNEATVSIPVISGSVSPRSRDGESSSLRGGYRPPENRRLPEE